MYIRNKVLALESIVVMFVLILLSFVVFIIIRSGSSAYENILNDKQNSESARVAYSYINMKIKQSDCTGLVSVVDTEYGDTLKIDSGDGEFCTYIFFAEDTLFECLTIKGDAPNVDASNRITGLDGFRISFGGTYIDIVCISESGGNAQTFEGTVGLRT